MSTHGTRLRTQNERSRNEQWTNRSSAAMIWLRNWNPNRSYVLAYLIPIPTLVAIIHCANAHLQPARASCVYVRDVNKKFHSRLIDCAEYLISMKWEDKQEAINAHNLMVVNLQLISFGTLPFGLQCMRSNESLVLIVCIGMHTNDGINQIKVGIRMWWQWKLTAILIWMWRRVKQNAHMKTMQSCCDDYHDCE